MLSLICCANKQDRDAQQQRRKRGKPDREITNPGFQSRNLLLFCGFELLDFNFQFFIEFRFLDIELPLRVGCFLGSLLQFFEKAE